MAGEPAQNASLSVQQHGIKVGPDLYVLEVGVHDLREQDVNAHVMAPSVFERLVENIRKRKALESMPYCAQPDGEGPIEIVSGHHRVRAARAAGLERFHVLVDTSPITRSQIVAKQLAHNALVGNDDPDIVRQLVGQIGDPDDLLTTGLPEELLPNAGRDALLLFQPRIDFDWKTVSFTFLPHQLDNMHELLHRLEGRQDLVIVMQPEQFDTFVKAASAFARVKEIRAGGTAVAHLTEVALRTVAEAEADDSADDSADNIAEHSKDRPDATPSSQ